MKILNIVLAVIFFSFIVVQYNDPDPIRWMAIYGIVTAVCALAAFGKYYKWLILLGLGISLVWMLTLLPDFINWIKMGEPDIVATMKAETPYVELTREFLGLVLCVVVLGFQYIMSRKKVSSHVKSAI